MPLSDPARKHIVTIDSLDQPHRFNFIVTCSCGWQSHVYEMPQAEGQKVNHLMRHGVSQDEAIKIMQDDRFQVDQAIVDNEASTAAAKETSDTSNSTLKSTTPLPGAVDTSAKPAGIVSAAQAPSSAAGSSASASSTAADKTQSPSTPTNVTAMPSTTAPSTSTQPSPGLKRPDTPTGVTSTSSPTKPAPATTEPPK